MESSTQTQPKNPIRNDDDRYRFIGFGVFPKQSAKFWKSDSERKQYEDKIQSSVGSAVLNRDESLLRQEVMTSVDRIILSIVGLVLIATTIMPWVSYRTMQGTDLTLTWGAGLGILLGHLGAAFAGGIAVGLSAILALVMMIGGPLVGLWIIASVWMKAKGQEAYLLRLRLPLKIGYTFLYAGLAIFVLSFIGGHIPGFESWGMIDPGEKYGISTLLSIISFGPYVIMAVGLVAGVKSGEL